MKTAKEWCEPISETFGYMDDKKKIEIIEQIQKDSLESAAEQFTGCCESIPPNEISDKIKALFP